MKQFQISCKAIVALLLVFCLLAGQFPALAASSGAETPLAEAELDLPTRVEQLNEKGGGTITLNGGRYEITRPLNVTTPIIFTGSGTITTLGTNWAPEGDGGADGPYGSLITVQGTGVTLTISNGITIDPSNKCRAICVTSGASLHLSGCTITRGYVSGTQQGAGVLVIGEKSSLVADDNTQFLNNTANLNSATSGGALRIYLARVTFPMPPGRAAPRAKKRATGTFFAALRAAALSDPPAANTDTNKKDTLRVSFLLVGAGGIEPP